METQPLNHQPSTDLSHGAQGRKYDAAGKRNNWWDPATEEYFDDRAACLVRQFNNFTVSGGKHVSGAN